MSQSSPDSIAVLHVDDAPDFVDLTKTYLEREDDRIRVSTATSASEGLTVLHDRRIDCIVSDYDMPGNNGIEFLETVREHSPELPFILYTGKGSEELASEAISAGVTDYLQKQTGSDQYTVLANRIVNAVARYRATEQLAEAEARYRSLFSEMNEGVALHELLYDDAGEPTDYRIVDVNRQYESITGRDSADVVGNTATDVYDSDEPPYLDRYAAVVRTGESIDFETYYPPLEKHFHVSAFSPSADRFATVFSDVTDRKRTEEKLREFRETYEHLFDSINDAVFVIDSEGDVLAANETACTRLGYDESELLEMTPYEIDLTAPETTGKIKERIETIEREGELTFETVHLTKSGERIPVEVTARQIEYFGTDAIVSVARDISARSD